MKQDKLLRLNLQFFAEDNQGEENNDTQNEDQTNEPEGQEDGGGEPEKHETPEDKAFTQEDIDRIVKERLDRERKKREEAIEREREEAERKRLEENEEYKDLADKYRKELEDIRTDALKAKKESLLAKAGYSEEQIGRYAKYLDGDSSEDLNASLEALKKDIPPKKNYADPKPNNGTKQEPAKRDLTDKGKSNFQRLKELGRIK